MPKLPKNLSAYLLKHSEKIVILFLIVISFSSFLYYFQNLNNLPYADARSRLNIARKVVDNITPGFTQVGNVWLPLPQLLMLPFVWNDYLWHTGIAGYLMSGSAFVLGGLFVYKSAKLITRSIMASVFSLSIYALNINLLYLQTTAMSESIFICSLASTMYFFLRWFKFKKTSDLMLAALSVSAMTLIRYEGLAILLPSIPMVFIYSLIKQKNYHHAEGNTFLYAFLACLGFALWTLYLTVIFGDPLYWKNYYAAPQGAEEATKAYAQAKPLLAATWQYFASFVWMVGIIPTIYTFIGLIILGYASYKRKSWIFLPLTLPLYIFLFMVMTLMRNTPIVQPDLNLQSILAGKTSLSTGFNIRYGILLLPWVAIVCALIFRTKFTAIKIILFALLMFQFHTYWSPDYTVMYKIPDQYKSKPTHQSYGGFSLWIQQNYDSGKILISAGSMEDQIFLSGFNYNTFIHEGAGKYWKESLDNPSRYAKWVVINYGHGSDELAKKLNKEDQLARDYKVVYAEGKLKVFKKNTDAEITVK